MIAKSITQAVILAGGEGTRLRPLTHRIPKPLVPVLNRPFLEYTLAHLRRHGVTEVVLALHHLADKIRAHFGDGAGFGVRIAYSREPMPLGTAGAVKHAQGLLGERFFVFNGDVYMDLDLAAMAAAHGRSGALASIALTTVEDPSRYGVVETTRTGSVRRFLEKPTPGMTKSRTINAGCYILEREALDSVPPGQPSMFERDLFPSLLAQGLPIHGYRAQGYWVDMGTPQGYLELHHTLLRTRVPDPPPPGAHQGSGIWLGQGSRIHPTARLQGPLVIGANCTIGPGVLLKGPAVLGDGCTVGEGAIIRGSVIWDHVEIGVGADLRRCLVGGHSAIGAGISLPAGRVLAGNRVIAPSWARRRAARLAPAGAVHQGAGKQGSS